METLNYVKLVIVFYNGRPSKHGFSRRHGIDHPTCHGYAFSPIRTMAGLYRLYRTAQVICAYYETLTPVFTFYNQHRHDCRSSLFLMRSWQQCLLINSNSF